MPTYTIEPVGGISPVGQIEFDPSSEAGATGGVFYESSTERVFFPGGFVLTFIEFTLAATGLPSITYSQTGVRAQLPSTLVTFIHLADHPPGLASVTHTIADDTPYGGFPSTGLDSGSFPYRVPSGGVFLWVEFDAVEPGTVTSGLLTIEYRRAARWWAGVAGSG